jgi:hypothetical protein
VSLLETVCLFCFYFYINCRALTSHELFLDEGRTHMRGRPFIFVSTTLLALVFSGLGHGRQPTIELPTTDNTNRLALVIGNATYPDAGAPLPNIEADAAVLADALRRRGYDVEFVTDATKEQLSHAVDRLEAKVRPGSTLVLSFGGYAIQSEGQNYLLPVDAKIWTERDVRVYGVSVSRLLSEFERAGAQQRIALLDASRRNPFERRFRSYSHGLASMPSDQNELIASDLPPDEVAEEQHDSQGSPAKALAAELQVPPGASSVTQAALSEMVRAILTQPVISPAPVG